MIVVRSSYTLCVSYEMYHMIHLHQPAKKKVWYFAPSVSHTLLVWSRYQNFCFKKNIRVWYHLYHNLKYTFIYLCSKNVCILNDGLCIIRVLSYMSKAWSLTRYIVQWVILIEYTILICSVYHTDKKKCLFTCLLNLYI